MGKYRSQLMGFAIIWVMLLHGSELYPNVKIPLFTAIAERGNIGVDIFLFLSGFGLWFSYNKNTNIKNFYIRRFIRVVLPYLIISLPFWVYSTVHQKLGVGKFISDYLGISFITEGVVTTWYIFLIVFLYAIFPLISSIERKIEGGDCIIIGISLVSCIVLSLIIPALYSNIEIAITRIPAFILGIVGARIISDKRTKDYICFMILALLSVLSFLISVIVHSKNHDLSIMLYRFGSIGVAFLIMAFIVLMFRRFRRVNFELLKRMGGITLEIYLFHIFFRMIIRFYGFGLDSNVMVQCFIWAIVMILSTIAAFVFQTAYNKVINKGER
ncbi:acyltransferase [Parabacteroides sp.]|uniref:acyltransferase n=1 Tax=Parabacteroides sp. TaxID=1869337 RepID=UPI00257B4C0F|nr:acyltransferase [Parabacteroides sp.]